MELLEGQPALRITQCSQLAERPIVEIRNTKGIAFLNDEITEGYSRNNYLTEGALYKFKGVDSFLFESLDSCRKFKEDVEALVLQTNLKSAKFKVRSIDDILFITLFYFSYSSEAEGSYIEANHLEELIDVFVNLNSSALTSTPSDYIMIPDASTGINTLVSKTEFTNEELILNGGFKSISTMVGPSNERFDFPSDRVISIRNRSKTEEALDLSHRVSQYLAESIISYIIQEHRKANTEFYKDLCSGNLSRSKWGKGRERRVANHKRRNKILYHIILHLEDTLDL